MCFFVYICGWVGAWIQPLLRNLNLPDLAGLVARHLILNFFSCSNPKYQSPVWFKCTFISNSKHTLVEITIQRNLKRNCQDRSQVKRTHKHSNWRLGVCESNMEKAGFVLPRVLYCLFFLHTPVIFSAIENEQNRTWKPFLGHCRAVTAVFNGCLGISFTSS